MSQQIETLQQKLGEYLSAKWGQPTVINDASRIPGGASRETWRLAAQVNGESRGLIIRLDPPSSLIDTDRRTEYRAYQAAFQAGLPVPEPLVLEEDTSHLGQAFSIMTEIANCESSPQAVAPEHCVKLGEQKWQLLGKLAKEDPIALGLDDTMAVPTLENCASEQLEYWAGVIIADELHPNPVAHAAIRWLRKNLPAPAQKLCLVHGDYRSGNFLFNPQGEITGILDWEMAHLGDPLEDLAWSLDPLWSWDTPELAGNLLPHKDAVRLWEQASGLSVDLKSFEWWRVFAALKGIAIWISSSEDFHSGTGKEPILGVAGWMMTDRQQQILLDYLSPISPSRFKEPLQ